MGFASGSACHELADDDDGGGSRRQHSACAKELETGVVWNRNVVQKIEGAVEGRGTPKLDGVSL